MTVPLAATTEPPATSDAAKPATDVTGANPAAVPAVPVAGEAKDAAPVAAPVSAPVTESKPEASPAPAVATPAPSATDAVASATDKLGSLVVSDGNDSGVASPAGVAISTTPAAPSAVEASVPRTDAAPVVAPSSEPTAPNGPTAETNSGTSASATVTTETTTTPAGSAPTNHAAPSTSVTPEATPKVTETTIVPVVDKNAAPTPTAGAQTSVTSAVPEDGEIATTTTGGAAVPAAVNVDPAAVNVAPASEKAADVSSPVKDTAGAPSAVTAGAGTGAVAAGAGAVAAGTGAAAVAGGADGVVDATVGKPDVPADKTEATPKAQVAGPTPAPVPDVTVANWGTLPPDHPLLAFHAQLGEIVKEAGHSKIWGITLDPVTPTFSTLLVLQKYLRSTDGVLVTAARALGITLKWRREYGLDGPVAIWDEPHGDQFNGLGYLTHLRHGDDIEVVTWNMYCDVHDLKTTFGDVDKFVRWRVALMERAMAHLDLAHTTVPIPDYGKGDDPHRMVQVHVYTGMAFLRMDPHVKAAAKNVISIIAPHYPETLSRKLFVGVPRIMNWVYTALTFFVSAATAKKFAPISAEEHTAAALGDPAHVPKRFGGTGPDLADLDAAAALEAEAIEHPVKGA